MNKRLTLGIAALLLLFIGLWAWRNKRARVADLQSMGTGVASNSQGAIKAVSGTSDSLKPDSHTAPANQSIDPKAALIDGIMTGENAKPLDFYGRVVDQEGRPVPGVKIRAGIGLVVSFTQSGGHFVNSETDSGGNFQFLGLHGAGMGPFILSKDGYSYDQNSPTSSRPSDYVPDAERPVIFHVWKLKGPEPMVHVKVHAYVPCDGTPEGFDVLTADADPAGDLVITLTRNPVQIDRNRPFDWSATVEIRNGGGLIPINDSYPYEAPAGGYEPKVTIDMPTANKSWRDSFDQSYYFMSGNGKVYGRMEVRIKADFQPPPTLFNVDIYANPAGSRNLEYIPDN
jgi:hypothetical protein